MTTIFISAELQTVNRTACAHTRSSCRLDGCHYNKFSLIYVTVP